MKTDKYRFNSLKKGLFIWVATLFLLIFLFCQTVVAVQPALRIAYPEFWPFFTMQETGGMTGFFYEIVTEALDRMGIKAVWEAYPWSRCQALVQSGDADAMVTVPTSGRLRYAATHNDPFYLKELKIFTYAGHPRFEAIKSIKSIGDILAQGLTVVTYNGNGWNDTHIRSRGIKVYEAPLIKSTWLMLANKRGDIAIEWPGAAWPIITGDRLADSIVETDVSLEAMPFHLLIGRQCDLVDILPRFNEIIKEMQADGTIDVILKKYVGRR